MKVGVLLQYSYPIINSEMGRRKFIEILDSYSVQSHL